MSKKDALLVKGAFYLMIGAGLVYAATRTLNFIEQTIPSDSKWSGYLYLFFTGIGAVIWMYVYLKWAQGAGRRALSFAMVLFDLGAELAMVYADTQYVSGQNGLIQMTADETKTFILASVAIVGVNILAGVFYELWNPEHIQAGHVEDMMDDLQEEALAALKTPDARAALVAQMVPVLTNALASEIAARVAQQAGQLGGIERTTILPPTRSQTDDLIFPSSVPAPQGVGTQFPLLKSLLSWRQRAKSPVPMKPAGAPTADASSSQVVDAAASTVATPTAKQPTSSD